MLHVPLPSGGEAASGNGSSGDREPRLASLAWAPSGSPPALLTATQQARSRHRPATSQDPLAQRSAKFADVVFSSVSCASHGLCAVVEQGALHVWTQLPAQPDAGQPATVTEWSGETVCDVGGLPGGQETFSLCSGQPVAICQTKLSPLGWCATGRACTRSHPHTQAVSRQAG